MRKVVFCQADAGYYRLLRVALGSFARYNPGWEYYIVDMGLTEDQRSCLGSKATLRPYERTIIPQDGDRYAHAKGRLLCLSDLLVQNPDTVYLQLDLDTVCLGSVDPWVSRFVESPNALSFAVETAPMKNAFRDGIGPGQVVHLFPRVQTWWEQPTFNWGIFLCRGSAPVSLFQHSWELLEAYPEYFRWSDQSTGAALIYDSGFPTLFVERCWNLPVYQQQTETVVADGHFRIMCSLTHQPVVFLHYCGYILRGEWFGKTAPSLSSWEGLWQWMEHVLQAEGGLF